MKTRIAAVMISLFMIAAAVTAHGNKKHVMGILQSISAEAMTVKTGDGKIVTVRLTATTMYVMRDGKSAEGMPAKFSDLTAVGCDAGTAMAAMVQAVLELRPSCIVRAAPMPPALDPAP